MKTPITMRVTPITTLLLLLLPTGWALTRVPLGAAGSARGWCSTAERMAHLAGAAPMSGSQRGWAAACTHRSSRNIRCGLLSGLKVDGDDGPILQPGQKVRVSKQVTFLHVPGHKDGFQAQGSVGIVTRVIDESNLSPNRKVKIQFEEPKKWAGHFESFELEVVAS